MGNRQTISFNNRYPDDIIHLILLRVDIVTLRHCSLVCRQFVKILRRPYFWKCKLGIMSPVSNGLRIVHQLTRSPLRQRITKFAFSDTGEPLVVENIGKNRSPTEIELFAHALGLLVNTYDEGVENGTCKNCHVRALHVDRDNENSIICMMCLYNTFALPYWKPAWCEIVKPPNYQCKVNTDLLSKSKLR